MKIEATKAAAPTQGPAPLTAAKAPKTHGKEDPALSRACKELEGVFVRQLLQAAKIGGEAGKSGYGSMAVDALASAITDGGGLGLADRIREALDASSSRRS